jgi:hypothetical protein
MGDGDLMRTTTLMGGSDGPLQHLVRLAHFAIRGTDGVERMRYCPQCRKSNGPLTNTASRAARPSSHSQSCRAVQLGPRNNINANANMKPSAPSKRRINTTSSQESIRAPSAAKARSDATTANSPPRTRSITSISIRSPIRTITRFPPAVKEPYRQTDESQRALATRSNQISQTLRHRIPTGKSLHLFSRLPPSRKPPLQPKPHNAPRPRSQTHARLRRRNRHRHLGKRRRPNRRSPCFRAVTTA